MVSVLKKIISASAVVGVKALANFPTTGQMSITAIQYGQAQNDFGVEILDTVTSGGEIITWSKNKVTIEVEAGVSTITLVLAALATAVGTPWGTIAAIAAGSTTVAALPLTAMRHLPASVPGYCPSLLTLDLFKEGGEEFRNQPVMMLKNMAGGAVTLAFDKCDSNLFAGTKAYAEKNNLSFRLLFAGEVYNDYTVTIVNSVSAGSETVIWAGNNVTINVQGGVSTVAQVLAGAVTGTPWATIGKAAAATTASLVAAQSIIKISALTNVVGGADAGTLLTAVNSTVVAQGSKTVLFSELSQFLRISGFATTETSEVEVNVLGLV